MSDALDALLAQQAGGGTVSGDPLDRMLSAQAAGALSGGAAPAADVTSATSPALPGFFSKAGVAQLGANAGNMLAGAARAAGGIGATILAPYDMAKDALDGKGLSLESNRQRRTDIDGALRELGADPTSLQYQAAKLGTEVAGTMGAGSLAAAPVKAVAAAFPAISRVATPIANSIESGGFSLGQDLPWWAGVPARIAGGAINGGAQAGLVNPADAKSGAKIGAALPGATMLAGGAAQMVARAIQSARTPQDVRVAQDLAAKLGVTADDLRAATTGPQMIPGYQPTVPQIVQNPEASQLQRTLQTAGNQSLSDAERVQQGQFRQALDGIAPLRADTQDAANRAGSAIQAYALPAEAAARARVGTLFDAIPSDQAMIQLPMQAMQDAQTRFLGPGTFGKGGATAEQAMQAATHIGMDAPTMTPRSVPFDQIQALRSSIGEAIGHAQANGQNNAAAALTTMKNAIDNKVADVAAGNALPGEVFTPEAIDAWGQALNAHAEKMRQFGTGPQVGMFRMGGDGQPAIQGAEIPGKFYNPNRSQVEDMQAFNRLIGDNSGLAQELKSYALTNAAGSATAAGNLGDTFMRFMRDRSGANQQLFSPQEQATIREVGNAVQRQMAAENLGRVTGPDTAQKLASLQSNGMLDNKAVDMLARRMPFIGRFTGAGLDALRRSATQARNSTMGGLLADPTLLADTLDRAPGLLNLAPDQLEMLTQGAYRVAPLLGNP